jgi:methionine salvage enolase-phosphatase E1
MNTYNIEVNGITVIKDINKEELDEKLKIIRGLVWTSGGKSEDIHVSLNNDETHCND